MLYVVTDKNLKTGGKLGFVITGTLFQTEGGGAGFRRFQLGSQEYMKVLFLDDMSLLQPFEGASNRTAVVITHVTQPRAAGKARIAASVTLERLVTKPPNTTELSTGNGSCSFAPSTTQF